MSFEQLSGTYDSDYYAAGLGGLGSSPQTPILPAYVMAGTGVPADLAVKRWAYNTWTVQSYNGFLKTLYQTLLNWDRQGWTAGCWSKYPSKRREWSKFVKEFSERYSWGLLYTYVSSDDELLALNFMGKLLTWSNWLNIVCDPRVARKSDPASLNGFGDLGIVPLIVYAMAGSAVAAGVTVATWLAKDTWSVGEYNAFMKQMYDTILIWDRVGWDRGCWRVDPTRREMWSAYMQQFHDLYAKGTIPTYSYLPDGQEKVARNLMQRLAEWGTWLNATCAARVKPEDFAPDPDAPPPPPTPTAELADVLKWGAIAIAGGIAYSFYRDVRGMSGR